MLGNLKEFISVVQDGITSNNNLRQTLQEVQKVTNIFNKDTKLPPGAIPRDSNQVNYGAGGELLEKCQEDWVSIHDNAEKNAKAAEEVDKLISEIHDSMERRLKSATELAQNLAYIPTLTATVAEVMDSLKNVQKLLKTVEGELVDYEEVVERSKMENWKLDHQYHLSLYKEKKMLALEEVRNNLTTKQSCELEKRQLAELQLRRDNSSVAFNNDLAKYLASGSVPSGLSQPPNVTLEQIQLDEDPADLEKFLDS